MDYSICSRAARSHRDTEKPEFERIDGRDESASW
jgi:hypothetical protein